MPKIRIRDTLIIASTRHYRRIKRVKAITLMIEVAHRDQYKRSKLSTTREARKPDMQVFVSASDNKEIHKQREYCRRSESGKVHL